jgi:hypothetical protein
MNTQYPMNTNKLKNLLLSTAAAVALAATSASATAAMIVQPTNSTLVSSPGGAFVPGLSPLANAINGAGFEYGAGALTYGNGNTVSNGQTVLPTVNPPSTPWFTPGHYQGTAYLTRLEGDFGGSVVGFAFDQKYTLNGVYLWNYQEEFAGLWYGVRGLKNVTISLYDDITLVGTQSVTFAQAADEYYNQAEFVALTETANVNGVTFTINSNQANGTNGFAGFGEVRFTAVPEPSTLAMLTAGLATVLFLRRRRS